MVETSSIVFFGFLSYYSSYFIDFLLFLLKYNGIHKYVLKFDKDLFKTLIKKLENECVSTDTSLTKGNKKTISGWFWNKKIIGYLSNESYEATSKITFLTTEKYFDYLIESPEQKFLEDDEIFVDSNRNKISVFSRYGNYKCFEYTRLIFDVTDLKPYKQQQTIIDEIVKFYNKEKRCSIFIEGPPCCGKSSIGYLLTKELNGAFTNSFNPIEPGNSLSLIVSRMQDWLSEDTPIIILVDEIDITIKKVHEGKIILNQEVSTLVFDKPSWSKFMDNLKFFTNVIVIFTSNSSKSLIDELDASYIRKRRIDLFFKLDEVIV